MKRIRASNTYGSDFLHSFRLVGGLSHITRYGPPGLRFVYVVLTPIYLLPQAYLGWRGAGSRIHREADGRTRPGDSGTAR